MVEPSPELIRKMRGTQILLQMVNNSLISKDEMSRRITMAPADFMDIETYNNLIRLAPWRQFVPPIRPIIDRETIPPLPAEELPAPTQENIQKVRNTQVLLQAFISGISSLTDIEDQISNNPNKFIDINTYFKLIIREPWIDLLPPIRPEIEEIPQSIQPIGYIYPTDYPINIQTNTLQDVTGMSNTTRTVLILGGLTAGAIILDKITKKK